MTTLDWIIDKAYSMDYSSRHIASAIHTAEIDFPDDYDFNGLSEDARSWVEDVRRHYDHICSLRFNITTYKNPEEL